MLLTFLSSVENILKQHDRDLSAGPPAQRTEVLGIDYDKRSVTLSDIPRDKETINVVLSLSGNNSGFLAEFEVALKSILLNAPLETDLNIHILADSKALSVLPDIWNQTGIEGSVWKSKIVVTTYSVDAFIKQWSKRIEELYNRKIKKVTRHTIAAYFRLFLNDVLPDSVDHVLYMDTDVVILANLANLWNHIDKNVTLQWGEDHCSGFTIMNVKKIPLIWDVASMVDIEAFSKQLKHKYGDQLILKAVNWTRPEMVAYLPNEWALSIGNGGLWRHTKHLVKYRPQVGMFHFNGGGRSKASYWDGESTPVQRYPDKYGIALYYVNLPWSWALFIGESHITNGEGYKLTIQHRVMVNLNDKDSVVSE